MLSFSLKGFVAARHSLIWREKKMTAISKYFLLNTRVNHGSKAVKISTNSKLQRRCLAPSWSTRGRAAYCCKHPWKFIRLCYLLPASKRESTDHRSVLLGCNTFTECQWSDVKFPFNSLGVLYQTGCHRERNGVLRTRTYCIDPWLYLNRRSIWKSSSGLASCWLDDNVGYFNRWTALLCLYMRSIQSSWQEHL